MRTISLLKEKTMKPLVIKDNSRIDKSTFSVIPNLTKRIADKMLKDLENEGFFVFPEAIKKAEDLTRDQMILQSENESYHTGNVMGFLGCGDERLIIRSRFGNDNDDYFFQYLLKQVLDFPRVIDLKTDANQNDEVFQFLLFLFPYYLKAAMRKGLFKTYIRRRFNDANVKGAIDVARHIKQNTPFLGKIAYDQREFSYDNPLTELIRHTIEFIRRKPYCNRLLARVKDEVMLVINATPEYEIYDRRVVIEENKKNSVRHAYFREYLALQRLCIMILQHEKHQIGSGATEVFGILFDGAWLWEEYVDSLIKEKFYHPKNKAGQGAQYLFYRSIGPVYPDFISRNHTNRVIADAKYKPKNNIKSQDYLQVLAYMFRFDAKLGFYLYPEAEHEGNISNPQPLYLNSGSTYEKNTKLREDIRVIKLGLFVPQNAPNYSIFEEQLQESEKTFLAFLSKLDSL